MTATLSTHVLDTSRGRPAAGLRIALEDVDGTPLAEVVTDDDGRAPDLATARLDPATYRLRFDTGGWFADRGETAFYPEVVVTFTVAGSDDEDNDHLHVPLLLSPYGYSTYRGS